MMVLLHKTVCRNGSKQYALQCFCIPQKVIFNLREQAVFNLPDDNILTEYWFKYGKPRGILFPNQWTGDYLTLSAVRLELRKAVEKANLPKDIHSHCFRHSFATHLLEDGVDIRYIQTLMGHRSPKSTEIYLHISNKALLGVKSPFDKAVGE